MRYKLGIICLVIASFGAGCSSISLPSMPWSKSEAQPNPTAEALFEEGMDHFKNKRYARAIDRFQKVKAEFPFSTQLIPAELKLAEAYYLNKQYPEAVAAFKEFQSLHPTNENIPFVIYHLGLAHYDQFTSTDRDQKMTEIAKGYFEGVVKNYPSSPYASQAKEKLAKCLEYLAEHEFQIASFYMREKKYPAARDRLEEILRRYKETPTAVKALYHLGESYRLDKNTVKAALAYEALIQHHPENPLAKEARTQMAQLEKEKQDPLALLLMRDRRPTFAPPSTLLAESPQGREIENPKSKIQNPKELNLVAKKEVVREEPGDKKGIFRRVMDTLNPFAPSGKEDSSEKKIETTKEEPTKEKSEGFFASLWSGLNPFGSSETKVEAARDPQLVGKIDGSLKERGIAGDLKTLASRPPTAELPKIEEPKATPVSTEELLGKIDARLKKEGKNIAELPPPPEAAPVLQATTGKTTRPAPAKAESPPTSDTSGLITNIDEALKRKGIEPRKVETTIKGTDKRPETQELSRQQPQEKVELAPRLPTEKKPFFLDLQEYQAQEKPREGEEARTPGGVKASQPPSLPASQLPQAVVKGPPQVKDKPAETKVTERKKSQEDEEESKGVLDQMREDLERLRNLLNPFSW